MPSSLLAKLDAEWDWFESRYKYPSKGTIRIVLSEIDGNRIDDGNQPTLRRAVFDKVIPLPGGQQHDIMEDRSQALGSNGRRAS